MPEPTAKPPEAAASAPPPKPTMLDRLLTAIGVNDPVAVAAQGGKVQASTCESLAAAPQNNRNVQMQIQMGCKMDNGL